MKKRDGFTLIELLIVILIITILMALLLPALERVLCRGRAAKAKALINSIATALEAYQAGNFGVYPPTDASNPPGSSLLANALKQPGPRGIPYMEHYNTGLVDSSGNFINPVWPAVDTNIGIIHYRRNMGSTTFQDPPPANEHPTSGVNRMYDLWTANCDKEVSGINNWGS